MSACKLIHVSLSFHCANKCHNFYQRFSSSVSFTVYCQVVFLLACAFFLFVFMIGSIRKLWIIWLLLLLIFCFWDVVVIAVVIIILPFPPSNHNKLFNFFEMHFTVRNVLTLTWLVICMANKHKKYAISLHQKILNWKVIQN